MTTDDRDILDVLREELDFVEKGGYGRSVRTPWRSKSAFQDSLSCLNYGYPYRAHACTECGLLQFVESKDQATEIPCHHIHLQEDGTTVEDLEEDEAKLAAELANWLRRKISEIEQERAGTPTV